MTDEAEKAFEAMIEAIARATPGSISDSAISTIAERLVEEMDRLDPTPEPITWAGMNDREREFHRLCVRLVIREAAPAIARAAAEAIGLNPGCVVVSEEATPRMLQAAWVTFRGDRPGSLLGPGPGFKEAMAAMIAASLPRQPEKEGATAPAPQAPQAR